MRHADTNIFIRYLTNPTDEITRRWNHDCQSLFAAIETGREQIATSEAVIAEVFFVLTAPRHGGLSNVQAAEAIRDVVAFPGLKMLNKPRFLRALDLVIAMPRLSLVDAIISCAARDTGLQVLSYDTDFDRVEGVTRVEPNRVDR